MAVDTRPRTLTAIHNYNLRNQGWPTVFNNSRNEGGDGPTIKSDPVRYTQERLGVYPSNADILWAARQTNVRTLNNLNNYSPWLLEKEIFGNTPAAKGHFIINAFDRNRQSVSGINSIYDPDRDKEEWRPVSTVFHAGRVWYLLQTGVLYYSQTLTEINNADKCYQDADPTSEDINELVATDGGYIDITGIAKGLTLIPVRAELAVLANNGVWTVSGTGEGGFTATDQEIRQITNVGAISKESVIEAEGVIYYWSQGGIYALVQDQVSGALVPQNISENTIQTLYLNIPELSRANSRGFYDESQKKLYWFYNDQATYDGVNFRYRYNKALVLDLTLQAYYTYSFALSEFAPALASMFQKKAGTQSSSVETVTSGGETVTSGGEDVTTTVLSDTYSNDVGVKVLAFTKTGTDSYQYSFAEFNDDRLLDWFSHDLTGVNFESYLETGHDIVEDVSSVKEANIVHTFFKRTEKNVVQNSMGGLDYDLPSSCFMQARWHWADSETSGKWTTSEQVYRLNRFLPSEPGVFDYGFDVIQTKNQVRGKGHALSLRFSSEQGKDFHLLGWSTPFSSITEI